MGLSPSERRIPCVLYIEDEESNRVLMQRIADKHGGVRLLSAATGEEGLLLAAQEMPAVVLCDGGLPDMSGAEVVKRLREDAKTSDMRVVIISGTPMGGRDMPDKTIPHLMKPINVGEILSLFDQL